MTRIVVRVAIGLLAASPLSTAVLAQDTGDVIVQASRVNKQTVGKTSSGIPIVDLSLSYGVSAKDLDLASHAGATELQRRVAEAAKAACKELGRQYPESLPSTDDCAKAATAKAMVRVNELLDAAAKKPK